MPSPEESKSIVGQLREQAPWVKVWSSGQPFSEIVFPEIKRGHVGFRSRRSARRARRKE